MTDYSQQPPPDETVRWSRGAAPAPSASVQTTIHQMTDQLQTVIEAAERAAEAIRHDAEEQARRHLAEAQRKADRLTAERVGLISELTDDLVRHAANVRDHSEQMVRALEDAINSVTDKLDQPAMTEPFGGAAARSLPLGNPQGGAEVDLPAPPARPAAHGTYTDIVGAPPPPPPASAPAPVPPRTAPSEVPIPPAGAPQPTPDAAAAAAAASLLPSERGIPQPPAPGPSGEADILTGLREDEEPPRSPPWGHLPGTGRAHQSPVEQPPAGGHPPATGDPETPPARSGPTEPTVAEDALFHASRLAAAGKDRETITTALRQLWGVSDPEPIVDRVLGSR